MQTKSLGTTGLSVPPLCFGGNVFGWTLNQDESFALLDQMIDLGWTFIDTADMYSRWAPGNQGGESETILGNWFASRGKRNKIVLYQAHQDDPDTPQDETMEAFARLVNAGKVRALGASNFSAARLASAQAVCRSAGLPTYQTLQPLYNLMERASFEGELQSLCVNDDIAVLPYYSLASGFLSGKYRTARDAGKSPRGPGIVDKYLNERGLRVLAALDTLAAELGCSAGTVAIAWVMHQPAIAAPIVSATNAAQLAELTAAAGVSLNAAALARLDEASRPD
mgnify:CR=1 FL=1